MFRARGGRGRRRRGRLGSRIPSFRARRLVVLGRRRGPSRWLVGRVWRFSDFGWGPGASPPAFIPPAAPADASASFLPVSGRYADGDAWNRALAGRGVGGETRSSSAPRRSSKSGPSWSLIAHTLALR